jgi:hypothetical protein
VVQGVKLLVDVSGEFKGVGVLSRGFERLDLWRFFCAMKHPLQGVAGWS